MTSLVISAPMLLAACSGSDHRGLTDSEGPDDELAEACRFVDAAFIADTFAPVVSVEADPDLCDLRLDASGRVRFEIRTGAPDGTIRSLIDPADEDEVRTDSDTVFAWTRRGAPLQGRLIVQRAGNVVVLDVQLPDIEPADLPEGSTPESNGIESVESLAAAILEELPVSAAADPAESSGWCDKVRKALDRDRDGDDFPDTALMLDPQTGDCTVQVELGAIQLQLLMAEGADLGDVEAAAGPDGEEVDVLGGARYVGGDPSASITGSLFVLDDGALYQAVASGPVGERSILIISLAGLVLN